MRSLYNIASRTIYLSPEWNGRTPAELSVLVHEMVHPFMDADFPACPAWFNEGLASLYEQS